MDPRTNIIEQEALARELLRAGEQAEEHALVDERVMRLCELVLAQIEWREKGGFDPFTPDDAPQVDPQANALLRVCNQYKVTRVIANPGGPAPAALPDGYLLVIENLAGRDGFECGIAPDGRVSS